LAAARSPKVIVPLVSDVTIAFADATTRAGAAAPSPSFAQEEALRSRLAVMTASTIRLAG
jgi:hypothetical protein